MGLLHDIGRLAACLLLTALFLIPVATYRWSTVHRRGQLATTTGAAVGLVVAPASFGLCASGFFLPLVGLIPTLAGGCLLFVHEPPGFYLATAMGLRESRMVVSNVQHVEIMAINAIFWSVLYGGVGVIVDRLRRGTKASA